MKTIYLKLVLCIGLLSGLASCKKGEAEIKTLDTQNTMDTKEILVSDSISMAASQQIPDKQFIKTAQVDMEVKNVYDATIAIEKTLKEMGGFVTSSNMISQIISEKTYNTSDKDAMLIRKFRMENRMQIRVPTPILGQFLQSISEKKLFLHTRIINAEDVTSNIKYSELEAKKTAKTSENISNLKINTQKVEMADKNMDEANLQQLAKMEMTDNLHYSTVDISLSEPNISISSIAVANSTNIENQYQFNFLYDAKNAFVQGFYLIQKLFLFLVTIWPLLMIIGLIFFFIRRRKTIPSITKTTE